MSSFSTSFTGLPLPFLVFLLPFLRIIQLTPQLPVSEFRIAIRADQYEIECNATPIHLAVRPQRGRTADALATQPH
jgi:hypothetical protein